MRKPKGYRGGDAARAAKKRGNMEGRVTPGAVDRSAVGPGSKFEQNTNTKNISAKNISSNKKTSLPIIGPVSLGINLVQSFLNRPKKTKSPFSANTIKQTRKPLMQPRDRDNNIKPQLCPDGTPPPCKAKTIEPTKANKPNFLSGFRAYNSGGVSSGPPPKRGPNPQVPPIKMKSGKMNNMTCPHRPDGIRGMGAAIKGHKFIGVK